MKQFPNKFTVTISEKDRQSASAFGYPCGGLLAAALVRMGAIEVCEVFTNAHIDGVKYEHDMFSVYQAKPRNNAKRKPFYDKSVVGTKIKFWRA